MVVPTAHVDGRERHARFREEASRAGATDPTGDTAVEDRVHTHDIHATILHVLGLNHEKLT